MQFILTEKNSMPTLNEYSNLAKQLNFKLVKNKDGNLYYVDEKHNSKIEMFQLGLIFKELKKQYLEGMNDEIGMIKVDCIDGHRVKLSQLPTVLKASIENTEKYIIEQQNKLK